MFPVQRRMHQVCVVFVCACLRVRWFQRWCALRISATRITQRTNTNALSFDTRAAKDGCRIFVTCARAETTRTTQATYTLRFSQTCSNLGGIDSRPETGSPKHMPMRWRAVAECISIHTTPLPQQQQQDTKAKFLYALRSRRRWIVRQMQHERSIHMHQPMSVI